MNNTLSLIIVALLAVVLFTLVDPFMYWMPSMVQMTALTIAATLLVVWVAFVLREGQGDERETQLRAYAGRTAYLSGVSVLTLALLVQGFRHAIDPWIPLTLIAMVAAKLYARSRADGNL